MPTTNGIVTFDGSKIITTSVQIDSSGNLIVNNAYASIVNSTVGASSYSRYTISTGATFVAGFHNGASGYKISFNSSFGTNDYFFVGQDGTVAVLGGNFNVGRTASGSNVASIVQNTSNTANSNAHFEAIVQGTLGGDPLSLYTIMGGNSFAAGIDNTTGCYTISFGGSLGTADALIVDPNSQVTLPEQVSFIAYRSADVPATTGDGTPYTVIFDQYTQAGLSYDHLTGIFTALRTGWHAFDVGVMIGGIDPLNGYAWIELNAGGDLYRGTYCNPNSVASSSGECTLLFSKMIYLTASTQVQAQITVSGNTVKNITVRGINSPRYTSFSGGLIH